MSEISGSYSRASAEDMFGAEDWRAVEVEKEEVRTEDENADVAPRGVELGRSAEVLFNEAKVDKLLRCCWMRRDRPATRRVRLTADIFFFPLVIWNCED